MSVLHSLHRQREVFPFLKGDSSLEHLTPISRENFILTDSYISTKGLFYSRKTFCHGYFPAVNNDLPLCATYFQPPALHANSLSAQ